ncbi:MAG: peptidoglycan DD-metalloendopeptidase family protein [Candidatus Delongbacteria bacterium]|nr:peptidoglycan DD-metalloendopeptidase family protein [Candidatus Delongbacteria bacterium]
MTIAKPNPKNYTSNTNPLDSVVSVFGSYNQSADIKKYSQKLKVFYREGDPIEIADKWELPFDLTDRSDIKKVHIISPFGAYRSSRVKGHRHSGIDIVPAAKMKRVEVFAISKGIVCLVNQDAPNKTVIIKHKLSNGEILFSAYIHLKDILVENGQSVDSHTKIGVLYTRSEAQKYDGNYDHLHLEIKKRIDDYSCASWLCMSRKELNEYFISPLDFLNQNLNP